jgi:hypothetical protein
MIIPILASQLARMTGVSHGHRLRETFLNTFVAPLMGAIITLTPGNLQALLVKGEQAGGREERQVEESEHHGIG